MDSYFPLVFLALSLYCFALSSQTQHSESSRRAFNVFSYGAVGDGNSDDTQAFKAAWDAVCKANFPSALHVPKSYSFMIHSLNFTGPCSNRLHFQIEGSLVAPGGPDSWAKNESKRYWLVFYKIYGMSMKGGGLVDGNGQIWWNLPCKPHKEDHKVINGTCTPALCDSPFAITFFWSSNITIQNLRITNSPQKHFWFENCDRVHIDSMHIESPADSPNTDGIHVYRSNHVKIHNSVISPGDDCISIGGDSHNVHIKNITCLTGHGISIGSLGLNNSRECVSNITVTNSTIMNSDNGLRVKTWQGGSGSVTNVTFDDIHMDTVRNPIIVDQYYCNNACGCSNQTQAIYITDISYKDIRGTYNATKKHPAVYLACSDTVPCTNLTFDGVDLKPAVKGQAKQNPTDSFCWNAYGDAQDTTPPVDCLVGKLPKPLPIIDQCSNAY